MNALPNPMAPSPFRVSRKARETRDTYTLELEPAGPDGPAPFSPGQFNMLYVFGKGEVPISISGDPARSESRVHTLRAVGTATSALAGLKKGDALGVRGPFGSHWPVEENRGADLLIVAGGIGLAPLRPAIYQALAQREKFGKIAVLYGARSPEEILYPHELERWRGRFDMQVEVTVDTARRGWYGHVGVVTKLISRAVFDPVHTAAMVCGPEIMMRFTLAELKRSGLADENIFVSMERNMKCAVGFCGHCQYGSAFVCKDGPVFRFDRIRPIFSKREI
ncbi:MAG: FAD/NAD(P)-binding protein [Nitrospinae bacterium]|nr:FAD/NAD(P)-binding protein [Nitrospinota bacterium]